MKKIAIIGTQGIPASYGGFESLVENLVNYKIDNNISYVVFCSSIDLKSNLKSYNGAELKYIKLSANGIQSIIYDIVSMIKSINYHTILILGVSGCCFLPILRLFHKGRIIVNIDGLEHKRNKWNYLAKKFLLFSEKISIKFADLIISDNKGIYDYVYMNYLKKESKIIAYGGDQVLRNISIDKENEILNSFELTKGNYSLSICRIEPENNCHLILESFRVSGEKLLFIGNWNKSEYGIKLKSKYMDCENIIIHDSIYDLDVLYVLRKYMKFYVHGHSAGGTNPSLVEAMFFGRPILTYDVIYNRETTQNKAYYFKNVDSLISILHKKELDGSCLKQIAEKEYKWEHIVRLYESLY